MDKKALVQLRLSEANRRIELYEAFIKQQEDRIYHLQETGHDFTEAFDFLMLLNGMLMTLYQRQAWLLQELKE